MKTYRIQYITAVAIALLGVVSCKDKLEIEPTQQSEDIFFSDQNRVQRGIGGAYAGMEYFYGANFDGNSTPVAAIWNVPGDDMTNVEQPSPFDGHKGITSGDGKVTQWWRRHYVNIGRTNFMLEKLEEPKIVALFTTPVFLKTTKARCTFCALGIIIAFVIGLERGRSSPTD